MSITLFLPSLSFSFSLSLSLFLFPFSLSLSLSLVPSPLYLYSLSLFLSQNVGINLSRHFLLSIFLSPVPLSLFEPSLSLLWSFYFTAPEGPLCRRWMESFILLLQSIFTTETLQTNLWQLVLGARPALFFLSPKELSAVKLSWVKLKEGLLYGLLKCSRLISSFYKTLGKKLWLVLVVKMPGMIMSGFSLLGFAFSFLFILWEDFCLKNLLHDTGLLREIGVL